MTAVLAGQGDFVVDSAIALGCPSADISLFGSNGDRIALQAH
jgi:hypothetical protein